MQTIMWNKRRFLIIGIVSVVLYIMLRNKNYNYQLEAKIANVKARALWEFLADFSNMKNYLIPHIKQFSIVGESGNYDHWKYSVSYEEPLPVWPHVNSFSIGHYSVTTDKGGYVVSSTHDTCYFNGWFCSKTQCDFHISQVNEDSLYKEDIIYECPRLLAMWCNHVADYTRQDFLKNLIYHFKTKQIH